MGMLLGLLQVVVWPLLKFCFLLLFGFGCMLVYPLLWLACAIWALCIGEVPPPFWRPLAAKVAHHPSKDRMLRPGKSQQA